MENSTSTQSEIFKKVQIHNDMLEEFKQTNGKTITCKAAVAWSIKAPFDVTDV